MNPVERTSLPSVQRFGTVQPSPRSISSVIISAKRRSCGSVGIVRYRHALAAGLLADGAGLVASIVIARLVWG